MRGVSFATAILAIVAIVAIAFPARATTCAEPNLIDSFPTDGAKGVPLNAQLTAHYDATAQYLNEDVTLEEGTDGAESVPVVFDQADGLLTVTPPNDLQPNGDYTIAWPKLHGIGTASSGRGKTVHFTTGTADDDAPPSFSGLASVTWDVRREEDDCTNALEERFIFNVTPGKAADDSGTDSLVLVVYQSSGGDVAAADGPKQVLFAPLPTEGDSVEVDRSIAAATGRVCFAAHVEDLTGKVSGGADQQVCVTTTAPPFFYGCTVAPTNRAPGQKGVPPLVLGAVVLSLLRRRRHRPAP